MRNAAAATVMPIRPAPRTQRRVVYLWDADYPWDVRVEKVCLTLTAAGHDVHIVARNRAGAPEREHRPEATVHRMPRWRRARRLDDALGFPAFFNPRWVGHLERTVQALQPDVIIARDLPLCPTAIQVGRRSGVPVIQDMAEHYPAMIREIYEVGRQRPIDYVVRNPRVVEAVERYCIRHCERTIVVVEEMRDRLISLGVPVRRIDVVSNTPPVARTRVARPPAREPDAPLRLVYLGIMEIPRGIEDLVAAAALLQRNGVRVQVDLVGTGRDLAMFEEQARALGVHGASVRFHGYVSSHERALSVIADADIGVLPHRRCAHWDHTIPNKLFDYMAVGLPVITSDARPFARIVQEADCGEVCASRDPEDLARAIMKLRDPARRERHGENGRRAVRQQYNWEHDTETLLNSVELAVGAAGAER